MEPTRPVFESIANRTPEKQSNINLSDLNDLKLIISPEKQVEATDLYAVLLKEPTPKKRLSFFHEGDSETPLESNDWIAESVV